MRYPSPVAYVIGIRNVLRLDVGNRVAYNRDMSHHDANTAARLTAADSALNAFLTARRNHAPDTDTKAREAAKWADRLSKYGLSAEARRIYGALAR